MSQIFPASFDLIVKLVVLLALLVLAGGALALYLLNRSPYWTNVGVVLDQPVPFSHKHHAGDLGIDCRFCHASVATSSYAGMPDTQTCMICHSQIWKDSPVLEPVRASYAENKPLRWNRLNEEPEFAYFNHSIHINKGVGCSTCHGRVDDMPITWKAQDIEMDWCLSCHRHPAAALRPVADITQMDWSHANTPAEGAALMKARNIQTAHLTDCSACHR